MEVTNTCQDGSKLCRRNSKLIVGVGDGVNRGPERRAKVEAQLILGLVLVIPVVLFPAAFVWYLNVGGGHAAVEEARGRRTGDANGVEGAAAR